MKLKHLLTIAALIAGAGTAWAQTDVTSTYITNADFSAITGWTKVSNKFSSTGTANNTTEWYLGSSNDYNSVFAAITQQLTGLQEGVYRFTMHGFFRTNNAYTNLTFFAETTDKTIYSPLKTLASGTSAYGSTPGNQATANTAFTTSEHWMSTMDNIIIDATTNSEGKLLIGMKPSGQLSPSKPSNQWICVGNAKLYKLEGAALDNLRDQVVTEATNLYNENTSATGASALNSAITTLSGIEDASLTYSAIKTLKTAITTFRTARLADATSESPIDATYLIQNAGFEDGAKSLLNNEVGMSGTNIAVSASGNYEAPHGWTTTIASAGNSWDNSNITCSIDRNNATGAQTSASEGTYFYGGRRRWSQGTNEISQVINDLPNGTYKISVDLGKATDSAVAGTFTATLNGNSVLSATPTAAGFTTFTSNSFVVDSDNNDLTINFANATSGNADRRFIIDNVVLTFYGDPLLAAQAEWQEVHDALAALDETALPDEAESAITTELAKTVPTTSVADVNTAKAALQALIDSYASIKTAYDKVNALITLATSEKDNSAGDADDKSTLATAISTATTNIETRTAAGDLTSDYNTLESARQIYVTSGAEPNTGHPFDYTFKLSNPSFEEGTTGWTLDKNTTGQWNYGKAQNNPVDGIYNLDAWAPQINYINVYQSVTLGTGSYSLKGSLYSSDLKAQHIYANNGTDYPSANLASSASWEQLTANFSQTEESSVNLGIYSQGNNVNGDTKGWFRADHFQLFFNGVKPLLKEQLSATISSANGLFNSGANVGTGIFQIPEAAGTAFGTAITTAQGVYDKNDATVNEITNAISTLQAAINTFNGAELNAPADGARYYLKVATSGHAKENKAIVVSLGATDANNQTGYGFAANASPAAHIAGAYIFTKVEGKSNTYNISVERPEGTVYLTYGSLNGSAAGWKTQQIQGTTNAENKGEFKIMATTTANVFNIVNTVYEGTDNYIDCQDGGSLYTDTNIDKKDFSLAEASQASVTVSCKAGKYGTVIFPFTPDVSTGFDGITFYSAESVNGATQKVQITEVAEPVANVPYLIKNDNGENFSKDLTGWGTATADSYTDAAGLLTGVFTAATIAAGANNYVLQTQGDVQAFYKVDTDFTATAYKCYLTYNSGAGVKALGFEFRTPTSVRGLEMAEGQNGTIFNLAGQRVQKAQKGLYIVNGKKVIVK